MTQQIPYDFEARKKYLKEASVLPIFKFDGLDNSIALFDEDGFLTSPNQFHIDPNEARKFAFFILDTLGGEFKQYGCSSCNVNIWSKNMPANCCEETDLKVLKHQRIYELLDQEYSGEGGP